MAYSNGEKLAVLTVREVMSGLSVIACLCMGVALLLLKKYRSVSGRLVLVLTTTVALSAASNLLTALVGLNSGLCIFQAVTMQFADVSSGVWTVVIAINLFLIAWKSKEVSPAVERWYHVLGWPISIMFTVLPATTTNYGQTEIWCWITGEGTGNVWRFVCFYIPLFLFFLAITILYLLTFIKLSRTFNEMADSKPAEVVQKERLAA